MSAERLKSRTTFGVDLLWCPQKAAWRWAVSLIVIFFGCSGFLFGSYISGLLVQSYIFAILALTADVIWGFTGILTFASAAVFGIGAYAAGVIFVHVSSQWWAIPVALIGGVSLSAALSATIGWLAFYSRIKVSEFYIAVVTLGLSLLFSQAASYGGALTGGSNGLSGFSSVSISTYGWYLIAGLFMIGAIVGALKFVNSDFGLLLRAIRDQEARCRYLGINTPFIKTFVFTSCNGVAAAAGVVYALYTTVVAPSLVGFVLATNVLIWVTLGGKGTILGPILAALLVNTATPYLSATIPLYWQGALGLLFVIVVVGLPQGLLPGIWHFTAELLLKIQALTLRNRFRTKLGAFADANQATEKETLFSKTKDRLLLNVQPTAAPSPNPTNFKANSNGEVVLEVHNVSKMFGSFPALREVNLKVSTGELVSIVGPNGAGKTSLVRCIADGLERTAGSVAVGGKTIGRRPPDYVAGLGVGRKFQGASVFDSLTVGECLKVASWKGGRPSIWRSEPKVTLPPPAVYVVERMGLFDIWSQQASSISHGQRQTLELAMVLALEPSVLLLDEPTAGLTANERSAVGNLLARLVSNQRLAIVLIEHDFEFVKEISTRMVVLHEGRIVIDGSVREVAESKVVNEIYLGRSKEVLQ